jgi:HlyD family secretion protein
MKRFVVLILFAAAIGGAFYYYFFIREKKEGETIIRVSGNIEVTEADVGFKIPGRIMSRFYEEGDWVEKGKVLAKLDDEDLRQRLDLAKATLMSAQARLSKLLAGSRPEELSQAEANLQQAQYDLRNKEIQHERMKSLYERSDPKEALISRRATGLLGDTIDSHGKIISWEGGAQERRY